MKLNDDLQRVQINRDDEVPVETNDRLWFLWVSSNGSWDAEAITRPGNILSSLKDNKVINVFCIWHGQFRTNLFLMDKKKLIKRLEKICGS
mgnify:CR=1 FL=1